MRDLKIKLSAKELMSALILQFFLYQFIKLSKIPGEGYISFIISIKKLFSIVFGSFSFSVGDILYLILGVFLLFWCGRAVYFLFIKDKNRASEYLVKIFLTLNILYFIFMLFFGLIYGHKNFQHYFVKEKIKVVDLKITAKYLFDDCKELRKSVTLNNSGEFYVDRNAMIQKLYSEQSAFYGTPRFKPTVKESLFSPVMKRIGVAGYYNPFTGEAQVVKGLPAVSLPFTIAHEMAHQAGVAPEDEANFYSFYMGESSSDKDYQYSVKYKVLMYFLREIYFSDPEFVKNILNNFSEGMKKDQLQELKYYEGMSAAGSDVFSLMNDAYLKANNQEGVIAYNNVVNMIVTFYKKNYPSYYQRVVE